jgi:hypothetical protein
MFGEHGFEDHSPARLGRTPKQLDRSAANMSTTMEKSRFEERQNQSVTDLLPTPRDLTFAIEDYKPRRTTRYAEAATDVPEFEVEAPVEVPVETTDPTITESEPHYTTLETEGRALSSKMALIKEIGRLRVHEKGAAI